MIRILRISTTAIAVLACSLAGAQEPTAQQLELLQQLPPEQRQALLEQYSGNQQTQRIGELPESPDVIRPQLEPDAGNTSSESVIEGNDTLLISIEIDDESDAIDRDDNALIKRLESQRLYHTDGLGNLVVLGIANPIPLMGLTPKQAAERLMAEPLLRDTSIEISLLPVAPQGLAALERFGYDLFAGEPSTFAPATNIPVPTDYVLGPGDELQLTLFGKENQTYLLPVDRNGDIQIPELGPVNVSGRSFDDVRGELKSRVAKQKIGVQTSVSLAQLRSIRVFVLGESANPGAYTISSLSTITHALYVSGGISPRGSLRQVELKRAGRTVRTLDLYDLLLDGDNSDDVRLRADDVIFVPTLAKSVSVFGNVKRPAIYEFTSSLSAGEAIRLAGGVLPGTDTAAVQLRQLGSTGGVSIDAVSLERAQRVPVSDGDAVFTLALDDELDRAVHLTGNVKVPGERAWRAGIRVSDVTNFGELAPNTDLNFALIVADVGAVNPRAFVPSMALSEAGRFTAADPVLQRRDRVIFFDLENPRSELLQSELDRLKQSARLGSPAAIVEVAGRVTFPGTYPLLPDMTVEDLIRAAGGLTEDAFGLEADLVRRDISEFEQDNSLIRVPLAEVLKGEANTVALKPADNLLIRQLPDWGESINVEVGGEVRFPGAYIMRENETLQDLITRAGGFTADAHPSSAVFTRESLREREERELKQLKQRLRQQIAFAALTARQEAASSDSGDLLRAQAVLEEAEQTDVVGRLVIDLESQIDGRDQVIVLDDGDQLVVPKQPSTVTIIGEVNFPTSHLYRAGNSVLDYVEQSGGVSSLGDDDSIYVVRANGSVERVSKGWFGRNPQAQPGDTIVVPLDLTRIRPLTLWSTVTQIMSQLALAVAALNSVGVF